MESNSGKQLLNNQYTPINKNQINQEYNSINKTEATTQRKHKSANYIKADNTKVNFNYNKKASNLSTLDKYINYLSAYRKKPVYYQLQKIMRKKHAESYNAAEYHEYHDYVHEKKTLNRTMNNLKNIRREDMKAANSRLTIYNNSPIEKNTKNSNRVKSNNDIDWANSVIYKKINDGTFDESRQLLCDYEINDMINMVKRNQGNLDEIRKKTINIFATLSKEFSIHGLLNVCICLIFRLLMRI